MPPSTHSHFGASSAYRWVSCPASVALCAKAPKQKSSSFANEGTAAHELAEKSITSKRMPDKFIGEYITVGDDAFEITPEMADFVSVYVREILKVASKKNNNNLCDSIRIETKFNLDWIGKTGMWGTCDASLADTANRTLHVFDLKYGEFTPVVAENNWQLMYYALGILGLEGVDKFDTVRLVIVQPRNADTGVTDWEISTNELLDWMTQTLIPAVDEAYKKDAKFCPSEKACKWCAGRPICPALKNAITDIVPVVKDSNDPVFPDPAMLTDEQIGKVLLVLPLVKPFFDSVAEYALDRALKGDVLSGFKLVKGRRGIRSWGDEKAVTEAFSYLGENLYEKKILSPAKLEKIVSKEMVAPFTTQPEAKLSLVPESDKREAVAVESTSILEDLLNH